MTLYRLQRAIDLRSLAAMEAIVKEQLAIDLHAIPAFCAVGAIPLVSLISPVAVWMTMTAARSPPKAAIPRTSVLSKKSR